ncbi:MAG: tRNA dimethylallyltransferase, partial [Candidatus Eisenbacteria bacterium]
GKPTPTERAAQPHRLFDLHALGESPSAGRWARAAAAVCEDAFARGVTPVLVGGSGLYLNALREGLHAEPPREPALRAALEAECASVGVEAMHAQLRTLDLATAERLAPRDRQRVLRALEVVRASGHVLAWWRERPRESPLVAEWRTFQLVGEPAWSSERIERRTREMWASGLLDETQALVEAGHEPALRALAAIGYDEALERLAGRMRADEAERRMNERTRQLAKRQRTWFRHQSRSEPLPASVGTAPLAQRIQAAAGVSGHS